MEKRFIYYQEGSKWLVIDNTDDTLVDECNSELEANQLADSMNYKSGYLQAA